MVFQPMRSDEAFASRRDRARRHPDQRPRQRGTVKRNTQFDKHSGDALVCHQRRCKSKAVVVVMNGGCCPCHHTPERQRACLGCIFPLQWAKFGKARLAFEPFRRDSRPGQTFGHGNLRGRLRQRRKVFCGSLPKGQRRCRELALAFQNMRRRRMAYCACGIKGSHRERIARQQFAVKAQMPVLWRRAIGRAGDLFGVLEGSAIEPAVHMSVEIALPSVDAGNKRRSASLVATVLQEVPFPTVRPRKPTLASR